MNNDIKFMEQWLHLNPNFEMHGIVHIIPVFDAINGYFHNVRMTREDYKYLMNKLNFNDKLFNLANEDK